jgi:hypothetical protein
MRRLEAIPGEAPDEFRQREIILACECIPLRPFGLLPLLLCTARLLRCFGLLLNIVLRRNSIAPYAVTLVIMFDGCEG